MLELTRFPARVRHLGWPAAVLLATLVAGCGGSGSADDSGFDMGPIVVGGEQLINPVFVSSEITTGDDRVSIGLLDAGQQPITDGDLKFGVYRIDREEATLLSEVDALPIVVKQSFTDTHTDGTIETHEVGELGVYVAHFDFQEEGIYGLKITGTVRGEEIEPLQARFNVLGDTPSVGVGEPAPLTEQTTLADVSDIAEIDTSDPPDPEMHQQTIAEAVTSGQPTVIVFATPSFCTSRICGPVKQTVDDLYELYHGRVNFVHVEPYDLEKARRGEALEALPLLSEEWGLTTEPWVFVIDADGVVKARFEAAVAQSEIEDAVESVLQSPVQSGP